MSKLGLRSEAMIVYSIGLDWVAQSNSENFYSNLQIAMMESPRCGAADYISQTVPTFHQVFIRSEYLQHLYVFVTVHIGRMSPLLTERLTIWQFHFIHLFIHSFASTLAAFETHRAFLLHTRILHFLLLGCWWPHGDYEWSYLNGHPAELLCLPAVEGGLMTIKATIMQIKTPLSTLMYVFQNKCELAAFVMHFHVIKIYYFFFSQ